MSEAVSTPRRAGLTTVFQDTTTVRSNHAALGQAYTGAVMGGPRPPPVQSYSWLVGQGGGLALCRAQPPLAFDSHCWLLTQSSYKSR